MHAAAKSQLSFSGTHQPYHSSPFILFQAHDHLSGLKHLHSLASAHNNITSRLNYFWPLWLLAFLLIDHTVFWLVVLVGGEGGGCQPQHGL